MNSFLKTFKFLITIYIPIEEDTLKMFCYKPKSDA